MEREREREREREGGGGARSKKNAGRKVKREENVKEGGTC